MTENLDLAGPPVVRPQGEDRQAEERRPRAVRAAPRPVAAPPSPPSGTEARRSAAPLTGALIGGAGPAAPLPDAPRDRPRDRPRDLKAEARKPGAPPAPAPSPDARRNEGRNERRNEGRNEESRAAPPGGPAGQPLRPARDIAESGPDRSARRTRRRVGGKPRRLPSSTDVLMFLCGYFVFVLALLVWVRYGPA